MLHGQLSIVLTPPNKQRRIRHRVSLRQRQSEPLRIDAEEYIAALHALVVRHEHFRHEARHIRRDGNGIGPHPYVARPRRINV
ncbi:hypothetical protein T281_17810 [Rhodomicrobium udaipurense JA643]|nr:hypothetical protein T281_17810 [Rhodomicrobium udaipurense JA643]